jgi:hypothetical protein
MIQKTRSNIIKSITSDELLCWIIKNGKTTLQEQNDESISAQESAAQLNEALDELEEESENGERVSITVSNKPLGFGRKAGSKMKCYDYALGSETAQSITTKATKQSYSKEYLDLVKKVERMEAEKKHNETIRVLNDRIEKLEKGSGEGIEGFTSILNHPLAMALIGRFFPMPETASSLNSINGLPEDLDELKKIDPEVNKLISAVLVIAKNNPDTYFQTKKMIIASV